MTLKRFSLLLGFAALLPASAAFAGISDSYPATATATRVADADRDGGNRGDRRDDGVRVSDKEVHSLISNVRARIKSFEAKRFLRRDEADGYRQRLSDIERRYASQRDRRGSLGARDNDELFANLRVIHDEVDQLAADRHRKQIGR